MKKLQMGQHYTVWFPAEEFAENVVVLADEGNGWYLIKNEYGSEHSINLNLAYSVIDRGPSRPKEWYEANRYTEYEEDDDDKDDDDDEDDD